jgi:hypothetical protein
MHSVPVPINVRCYSNSDIIVRRSEATLGPIAHFAPQKNIEPFAVGPARGRTIKRVYTMVSDYGPGIDAETAFQTGFKEAGGEIVGSVRFPSVVMPLSRQYGSTDGQRWSRDYLASL